MEDTHNLSRQKYGRDVLLQLRMHPSSLKKPDLQKLDIVKDKLYLHQINNHTISESKNLSNWGWSDSFQGSMKLEADAMFRYHRSFQDSFPWHCSFNGCSQKTNAAHHSVPAPKNWQFSLPDYINPLRKHSLTLPDYKFDWSIDDEFSIVNSSSLTPWSKQCCSAYDSVSKERCKSGVRNEKRVLPIIDPKNGKNILDSIGKNALMLEDAIFSNENGSEITTSNFVLSELGDHSCDKEEIDNCKETKDDGGGDIAKNVQSDEGSTCISLPAEASIELCDISPAFNSSWEKEGKQCSSDDAMPAAESCEESEKNVPTKMGSDFGVAMKVEDQQKVSLMMLREKIYAMKKEQQKMAILQRFFRFKKHQLEEGFRNLDDKRIEIGDWECSLLSKAKRLHEKECWLETRKLDLQIKEEKLEEKERLLSKKEMQLKEKSEQCCHVESVGIKNEKSGSDCSIQAEKLTNDAPIIEDSNGDYSVANGLDGKGSENIEKSSV